LLPVELTPRFAWQIVLESSSRDDIEESQSFSGQLIKPDIENYKERCINETIPDLAWDETIPDPAWDGKDDFVWRLAIPPGFDGTIPVLAWDG
jgi:hypothetical protein